MFVGPGSLHLAAFIAASWLVDTDNRRRSRSPGAPASAPAAPTSSNPPSEPVQSPKRGTRQHSLSPSFAFAFTFAFDLARSPAPAPSTHPESISRPRRLAALRPSASPEQRNNDSKSIAASKPSSIDPPPQAPAIVDRSTSHFGFVWPSSPLVHCPLCTVRTPLPSFRQTKPTIVPAPRRRQHWAPPQCLPPPTGVVEGQPRPPAESRSQSVRPVVTMASNSRAAPGPSGYVLSSIPSPNILLAQTRTDDAQQPAESPRHE